MKRKTVIDNICRGTLLSIAKHYETGKPLPEDVFSKIIAAKNFRAGSLSLRQVFSLASFSNFLTSPCISFFVFSFIFESNMILFFLLLHLTYGIYFVQIRLASVDMELHTKFDPYGELSVFDVYQKVWEKTSVLPPTPNNKYLCTFKHVFNGLSFWLSLIQVPVPMV